MSGTAPDYRGIARGEIIESLKDAAAFIETLNIGPEVGQIVAALKDEGLYSKIAAASSRETLSAAMNETGATHLLLPLSEIFVYHAATDETGAAADLHQKLSSWGGFNGAMLTSYGRIDEEMDRYLIQQFSEHAAREDVAGYGLPNLIEFTKQRVQGQPTFADDLSEIFPYIAAAIRSGDEDRADNVTELFDELDLRGRYLMKESLRAMGGLDKQMYDARAEGPFDRYGIVLNEGRDYDDVPESEKEDLYNRMGAALRPFYSTDEVQMTAIGAITMEEDPALGLVFVGTKPAAEAVAAAMPDQKVINSAGDQVIAPQQPGRKPGRKPAP